MTVDLSRLDVPLPAVEAEVCYLTAAAHTSSPSDRLACYLDIRLERHPELLANDASYPGFAEWVAAREASNRNARKEGS